MGCHLNSLCKSRQVSEYFWQYSVGRVGRHSGCQIPVMLKGFLLFPIHFFFWSNPSIQIKTSNNRQGTLLRYKQRTCSEITMVLRLFCFFHCSFIFMPLLQILLNPPSFKTACVCDLTEMDSEASSVSLSFIS